MINFSLYLALASALISQQPSVDGLKVVPEKENVVASRLDGSWQTHEALTQRLGGNGTDTAPEVEVPMTLTFASDPSVAAKIPDKYVRLFAEKELKVYMAGRVDFDGKICPFVLTQIRGNPHIMFWLELDGDEFGNGESFNVMLAVAKDKQNDLMFVGGDFNNQSFSAFERVEAESKK